MMYSPVPSSRRPRPPVSLAKTRLSSSLSGASRTSDRSANSEAATTGSTPSHASRREEEEVRPGLPVTSDRLGDIGDVSLALDDTQENAISPSLLGPKPIIGLGFPSALLLSHALPLSEMAQPSPPPPYGRDLPDPGAVPATSASGETPPRPPPRQCRGEDLGEEEESQEGKADAEERLRIRRATDAAKAIGLDLDFGVSNSGGEDDSELEEDEEVLRKRLRSVRRRLRQRDKELLMAAQVADQALRQHEQVLSQLSPSLKNRLPQLLSLLAVAPATRSQPSSRPSSRSASRTSKILSPPGSRFSHTSSQSITSIASILSPTFDLRSPAPPDDSPDRLRTIRMTGNQYHAYRRKASRPRAFHTTLSSPNQRYHQIQAEEAEQRIIALETALTEAQAGEENQRKAAARLRRDHEKLKRDLERAEEKLAEGHTGSLAGLGMGVGRRVTRSALRSEKVRDSSQEIQAVNRPRKVAERERRDEIDEVEEIMDDDHDDDENDWPTGTHRQGDELSRMHGQTHYRPIPIDKGGSVSQRPRRPIVPRASQRVQRSAGAGQRDESPIPPSLLLSPGAHEPTPQSSDIIGFSSQQGRLSREPVTLAFVESRRVRKPIPRSGFLSPPKRSSTQPHPAPSPNTPRLSIQSPPDSQPSTQGRHSRFLPSRTASTPSPARSLASIAASLAQSPGFTALAERMATMREFVEGSLGTADAGRMRSLGSELGSELGDWGSPIPPSHVPARHGSTESNQRMGIGSAETITDRPSQDVESQSAEDVSDEAAWIDEPDTLFTADSEFDEGDTTIFNSPAALPPLISAALSSLAAALAPTHSWGLSPSSGEEQAGPSHSRLSSSTSQDTALHAFGHGAYGTAALPSDAGSQSQAQSGPNQPVVRSGHVRRQSSPSPMSSHTGNESLILHSGITGSMPEGDPSKSRSYPISTKMDISANSDRGKKGKGKARETVKQYLGVLHRPKVERSSSSQSSIALAHRRVSEQTVPVLQPTIPAGVGSDGRKGDTDIDSETIVSRTLISKDEVDNEPDSIPARIIHDLIVWLVISLQFVEWIVVLGIRVRIDLQNGRNGLMRDGIRQWAGRRRYYL